MRGGEELRGREGSACVPSFFSFLLPTHNDLANRLAPGQTVQEGGLPAAGGAHLCVRKGKLREVETGRGWDGMEGCLSYLFLIPSSPAPTADPAAGSRTRRPTA